MTRRGFLRHTGRLAASGLTAAAIADRLAKDTTAQNVRKPAGRRPQRVAVIGVDHYHATSTPNYLRILQNEKVDILGVHAPDDAIAAKWAGEYNSTPYTDYRVMIEKTKPEFIVALGKHVAMPAEFRFLVETGIPFLMEKPWGIDDKTVNELADLPNRSTRGPRCRCRFATACLRRRPSRCVSGTSSGRSRTCSSASTSLVFNGTSIWGAHGCCRRRTPAAAPSSTSVSTESISSATSRPRNRRSCPP